MQTNGTSVARLQRSGNSSKDRIPTIPTLSSSHELYLGDARNLSFIPDNSIHLVVTSPPYFNLKQYEGDVDEQLGDISVYEDFLGELNKALEECSRILVPGGRICCVVGAITIARRNGGRHYVLPLPSDIQVRSREIGLDNLTPIMWQKVSNISLEASGSSRFLGKPNLPNGIIKNDLETIVMLRKPGGYRKPTLQMEVESRIDNQDYFRWFLPVWADISGASTKKHPAPFPVGLAYRLIRMFSFAGDTVLDPFVGTGSTTRAAIAAGRNSVGVEVEPKYFEMVRQNLSKVPLGVDISFHVSGPHAAPSFCVDGVRR